MFVSLRKGVVLIHHEQVCLPPQNDQNLVLKTLNGGTFDFTRGRVTLKCCLPINFTHHMIYKKMFVSFRKCLGTDTPQTSLFTTPESPKSWSETAKLRYVWLYKRMSET